MTNLVMTKGEKSLQRNIWRIAFLLIVNTAADLRKHFRPSVSKMACVRIPMQEQ